MTRMSLARLVLAAFLVTVPVYATAVSITDIVAAPESYSGQQVTVVGTALDPRASYAGETVYTLSADDRRITVFGRGNAPASGERLEVTAKVGWREGDEEFTWPPILLETGRHPAP